MPARVFSETYNPDRLIAGLTQTVTEGRILKAGENLTRGAVLGVITATSKLVLSESASTDGSEVPYAILAEDTDATAGDVAQTPVFLAGEFNQDRITLGTGHTVTSVREGLRQRGIFLKRVTPA